MPALSTAEATEKLATAVEKARPSVLGEIYTELFPEKSAANAPTAGEMAQLIRAGLEAEEIVDLWNVVIPEDRNVRYDEVSDVIHYNDEAFGYVA